jgi:UDP-2,3-diacylglucosamine pyrophosphatase LpxH
MHFGAGGSLEDPDIIRDFLRELRSHCGEIDRLVCLGDVWELWLARPEKALHASTTFLQALGRDEHLKELLFVSGNHDNCIHLWHREDRFFPEPCAGRPFPIDFHSESRKLAILAGSPPGLATELHYPFLETECGSRRVLLTHGHHLDYFASTLWFFKTHWLARLVLAGKRDVKISDIENSNCAFFEMMAGAAYSEELSGKAKGLYRFMLAIARVLGMQKDKAGVGRLTPIDKYRREIAAFLKVAVAQPADVFVFGHTHLAGHTSIELDEGRHMDAVNIGCWQEGHGISSPNTYLVLDGKADRITLWALGQPEPLVEL